MAKKPKFLNFQVDHMTLLVHPDLYNVAYAVFRIVFGVRPEDLIYEKRKKWPGQAKEASMTFAVSLGTALGAPSVRKTLVAVVQPSEPKDRSSHVRRMLDDHKAAAHWQHIAIRTPDLLAFHEHARALGVNFITPVLKDSEEDLIQVFSGEWFTPWGQPSGLFFEFVQRNPTAELLKRMERQAFFRDKTFLGLYQEKENEYLGGKVTPFLDHALFREIHTLLGAKQVWEITDPDLHEVEAVMRRYAADRGAARKLVKQTKEPRRVRA